MFVESQIKELIQKKGFIPLDEAMECAMSRFKESYYRTYQPIGEEGDFITSPEVSQMFGEMLCIWCIDIWNQLGNPSKFNLIEFGAGLGTLARDILRTAQKNKNFYNAINLKIIEINPILKQKQHAALEDFNIEKAWINDLYSLEKLPTIMIANEFFDALPIKQYIKHKTEWKENTIILDPTNGSLAFDMKEIKKILEQQLLSDHINAGDGAVLEESPESIKTIKTISEHIKKNEGAALIIDYGYDIALKFRKSYQYTQTLQAVKNHKYIPILSELGTADLSAHVDFWALKNASLLNDVKVYGSISQRQLLIKCGIDIRLQNLVHQNPEMFDILHNQYNRLIGIDQMGELFKAIAITSTPKIVPLGF